MSSSEPFEATAASCPVEHRGGQLMHVPYAHVAKVFEGFGVVRDDEGHVVRGGNPTDKPTTLPQRTKSDGRAPDYHTESTFTPEQHAFAGLAVAALNILARGEVMGERERKVEPLAVRIIKQFQQRPPSESSFGEAVFSATMRLFDDFGHFHPNLVPAFAAMFEVAGVQGTHLATADATFFLEQAINGTRVDLKARNSASATMIGFAGIHFDPEVTGVIEKFEVRCIGRAVAQTITNSATRAAIVLSIDEKVKHGYNYIPDSVYLDRSYGEPTYEVIRRRVAAISTDAAARYARGEVR